MAEGASSMEWQPLGEAIRQRRLSSDLTQVELAQLLDVGQTAISQWERGRTVPTVRNLTQLAKHLNCRVADLVAELAPAA